MSDAQLFMACTAIWGTTWIAITFQLGVVDAEASVAYRFLLASAILIVWLRARRAWVPLPLVDHAWAVVLGACYALNYQLIYFAEGVLPSGLVAVAGASILFFNVVLARLFYRTPVTPVLAAAALAGATGIVLVFFDDLRAAFDEGARDTRRGVATLLALTGAFAASCANVVAQRFSRRGVPVMTTNALWMGYASLLTVVVVAVGDARFGFSFTPAYVVSLLYLAVMGSVVAFTAFLTLLGRVGAGPAGYVAVITPVVALAVSSLVEDLTWPATRVVGVACIVAGQVALVRARRRA